MRLMMTFKIPVAAGNAAGPRGDIGKAIDKLVKDTNAEAAYFTMMDGMRAGVVVFEETDQSRLPHYNEPLMQQLDAQIDIAPVLSLEDLERGLGGS